METIKSSDLVQLSNQLELLYDNFTSDDEDVQNTSFKKALLLVKSKDLRSILDAMLLDSEDEEFKNATIDDKEYYSAYVKLLRIVLKICNYIYNYSGEYTGLTDAQYDELIEFYKDLSGDESIITEAKNDTDNVHHRFKTLRGTLDKIYKLTEEDVLKNKSQKSLDDWVKQTEKRYFDLSGETIDLYEEEVIVMPKFDGLSTVFECDGKTGKMIRALTRGDTSRNEAQDVSHIFKNGRFVGSLRDQPYDYGVKVEVMMLNDSLDEYNQKYHKDYKNTRSIVSSILNSKELDERVEYLHVVPLRISFIDEDGEESAQQLAPEVFNYPYLRCKLKETEKIREYSFNQKTVFPGLRCDGSVIQLTNPKVQQVLGRDNEKQKYEVAFKFTEEVGYAEVEDVIFTTGLFGRISPVVVFKPVKLKGNKVRKASLGSFSRFSNLELCKGDVIKVLYDIIPYVQFDTDDYKCTRSGKSVIKAPKFCPDCGELLELSESGDILRCNNKSCPCREKGKILNYCKKMNISNISYATIEDFYSEGLLRSIRDLYTLKDHKNQIVGMDGYNVKKIENILNEIDTHREVSASVLFGSLGIESISTKKFKNVFDFISAQEMMEIANTDNYDFFTVIPGIKEKTAKALVDGLHDNNDLIYFLLKELTLIEEVRGHYSVAFTKVRDEEMEKFITDNYGTIDDSLTKNTTILVVPTKDIKSSKTDKANKYGIPIVPIDELKEYITNNLL